MIQTKDGRYWQLAEGSEAPKGKVAAYPAGGGMTMNIPKGDVTDWNASFPENQYRHVSVGFDEPVCKAYLGPERWNGFEMPYVDRENLLKFIAYQDAYSEEACDVTIGRITASGDLEISDDEGATYTLVPSFKIQFEGKTIEVWDIGFGLVWEDWGEEQPKS